jgi:hypothetical protein
MFGHAWLGTNVHCRLEQIGTPHSRNGGEMRVANAHSVVLAAYPQAHPTRDQHGESRTGGEHIGDERSGLDNVLEVVKHEQVVPVSKDRVDPMKKRLGARLPHAHRLANGRRHEGEIRDWCKGDKQYTIREGSFDVSSDRERESGLADATWPGQRDAANVGAEKIGNSGDLRHLADKWGEWDGQGGPQIGHGRLR